MIELTDEQRQQLDSGKAIDVTDSQTAQLYVILRKDDELRHHLARSTKENGWEEPGMDDYDRYDEVRQKRCP